jgi:acetyl esterase/lipase
MSDPTAFDNADFIPDGHSYFERWAAAAAAFRHRHPAGLQRLDMPYGAHPRQAVDLFLPEGDAPKGLFVYIHGGFWRLCDRKDWSHMAAGAVGNGWAVAVPSYPLAPEVHVSDITASVAGAINLVAEQTTGPIVIAGSSAGGHLALRMGCPDVPLAPETRSRIRGILAISPLSDLDPLVMLPMNETLQIDAEEADRESPIRYPEPACAVQVRVGSAERPAFIDQSIRLADAWLKTDLEILPDRHHFDITDPLEDPSSAMVRAMLSMAG